MKKSLLMLGFALSTLAHGQMTMTSSTMMSTCDCYQLTAASANDRGAIWSPAPFSLNDAFDMTFSIYAGAFDGADGMAFVLQQNPTGMGDVGAGLGYRDLAPFVSPPISLKSLAIEFDTWNSSPAVVTDIDNAVSDHMGIESNGSVEHNLGGPYLVPNLETGTYHTFRVIWNPSLQVMTAFLNGNFIFAYNGDIINNIFTGNPTVYWGFTAACGGAFNEHRVCMYRNAAFTQNLTTVCADVPVTFTDASTSDLNKIVSYSWDFGDGSALDINQNPVYSYPTPGSYTAELTMTDISGCDDIATVTITVLPDIIVNVTGTDVTCFGDLNGQAIATPANGTGPYTYLWDDILAQTNATATGLVPNTYNVDVEDGLGCKGIGTITINEPVEVTVNVTGTDISCFGFNDGQATANVLTGVSPFDYLWNDMAGQITATATNLVSGIYAVTVTDDNGCEGLGNITIGEPLEFTVDINSSDANCFNAKDGQATAVETNGVSPFTYLWDDAFSQTSQTALNLLAGTYNVTVTDDNGCIATDAVVIGQPAEILITAIVTNDAGGGNGSIDATIIGGIAPYTTNWSNSATTEDINSLASGSYTLTVIDANGCAKDSTFQIKNTVGINDFATINFELYPNPTTGIFHIDGSGYYAVIITDAAGRVVLNSDATDNTTIDLSTYENGIYFVRIEKDELNYIEKVVHH